MMQNTESVASLVSAEDVATAVGTLASAAAAVGDLESGGGSNAESKTTSVTDNLIKSVATSMISKVDTETSVSLARRGATYVWGKVRDNITKKNLVDTFGRNGSLRRVCLEAVNCRKFSRPAGGADWRRRIGENFPHFKSLYLAFTVLLTAWSLLFNIWIMSGCLLLIIGWYYFNPLATLLCRMENPSAVQKFTVMIPVTIVVALLTGIISKVIELAIVSTIVAITHASFHQGVEMLPVTTNDTDVTVEEIPMATLESNPSGEGFSGEIEKNAVSAHENDDDDDDELTGLDDDNEV